MTPMRCGRCDHVGKMGVDVRMALVNRHRELQRVGRPLDGAEYEAAARCMDAPACDARYTRIHPGAPLDEEEPSWW